MLDFIIVDDEPLAHEVIEEFCNMIPHIQLIGNCYSAMEALTFLNENKVDFMFLDINMPKLNGLDFLRTLSNAPKVIITSAYSEFALEGYELNVVDYLLKPIPFNRLIKAVNKISDNKESNRIHLQKDTKNTIKRIFVKGDKKHHQIQLDNLLFIEAYGNYTKLFLKDEMIVSHEKISFYENTLAKDIFLRVHKSFLVRIDKIKLIEGNRILIEKYKIPIGQTYKSSVSKLLS